MQLALAAHDRLEALCHEFLRLNKHLWHEANVIILSLYVDERMQLQVSPLGVDLERVDWAVLPLDLEVFRKLLIVEVSIDCLVHASVVARVVRLVLELTIQPVAVVHDALPYFTTDLCTDALVVVRLHRCLGVSFPCEVGIAGLNSLLVSII